MSERRLPRIIQIGSRRRGGKNSPKKKATAPSDPSPSAPPPKNLFQTPTKGSKPASAPSTANSKKRIRGILKNPSHRFSGKAKSSSPKKNKPPSTPETCNANDSYEQEWAVNNSIRSCSIRSGSTIGSEATFGTTSTEGIEKTIEDIINNDKLRPPSSPTHTASCDEEIAANRPSASSAASVSSASTSSTICSSRSTTSKEELQRCARIKHIEDLTERIREAKARKLVERRAYRKEDRLLLRFARQLKAVCKESRENALNITILEESNQYTEDCYNQTLQELQDSKTSRSLLQERLAAQQEQKQQEDREHRNKILRVQDSELEAHKRKHQFNCQSLCESILEANNELDRMRALWEKHLGTGSSPKSSPQHSPLRQRRRKTKNVRVLFALALVVVFAITTFIIRATTTASSNTIATSIEATIAEQHRSLPPVGIIREDAIMTEPKTMRSRSAGFIKNDIPSKDVDQARIPDIVETPETTQETPENSIDKNKNMGCSKKESPSDLLSTEKAARTKQRGGRRSRRFRPKDILSHILRK